MQQSHEISRHTQPMREVVQQRSACRASLLPIPLTPRRVNKVLSANNQMEPVCTVALPKSFESLSFPRSAIIF